MINLIIKISYKTECKIIYFIYILDYSKKKGSILLS